MKKGTEEKNLGKLKRTRIQQLFLYSSHSSFLVLLLFIVTNFMTAVTGKIKNEKKKKESQSKKKNES